MANLGNNMNLGADGFDDSAFDNLSAELDDIDLDALDNSQGGFDSLEDDQGGFDDFSDDELTGSLADLDDSLDSDELDGEELDGEELDEEEIDDGEFDDEGFDDEEFDNEGIGDGSFDISDAGGLSTSTFDDAFDDDSFDNGSFGDDSFASDNSNTDSSNDSETAFDILGSLDDSEPDSSTTDEDVNDSTTEDDSSSDSLDGLTAEELAELESLSTEDLEREIAALESGDTTTNNNSTDDNENIPDEFEAPSEDASEYIDGAVVSSEDLMSDDDTSNYVDSESDFISDSGNIVVQDAYDESENGFELKYVDIEKIAITNRIRKMESVESLVQSIQSTGLLEPLTVAPTSTDGFYVLLDGLRRIQACARAGKSRVPCVVNNRVSTPEIPILEAMYNHSRSYTIREQIDYIDYLEKQKGIMNPAMIEYLLQMNSGDYTKLKDIINDNDDDIMSKLLDGSYDIAMAFKKLEQRRKKESAEEKENKKASQVYGDTQESGINQVEGAGEDANSGELTEEQIKNLNINLSNMDNEVDDADLGEMVEEDKQIEGYEPHKQKVGEREILDPAIRKAALARDNFTCRCCKRGGEQYVDILDAHHVLPVYCGGVDSVDNTVMLCVSCHRLVHLYATGDLNLHEALLKSSYDDLNDEQKGRYENEEIFKDEQNRFKRIIYLGSKIRKAAAAKGLNREKLKQEHPNTGIGRRKPGKNAPQEHA